MKQIVKSAESPDFIAWKQQNPGAGYDVLRGTETGRAVKASLLQEQGALCCYCEGRIADDDSHVEHFRPRGKKHFPKLELDYNNLLCSCVKDQPLGGAEHCGHFKGNWFDVSLVSPLDDRCEDRFIVNGLGEIKPFVKTDTAAQTTIDKLNLNCRKLQALRTSAIDGFIQYYGATPDSKAVELYLQRGADGQFNPYWSAIRDLLR